MSQISSGCSSAKASERPRPLGGEPSFGHAAAALNGLVVERTELLDEPWRVSGEHGDSHNYRLPMVTTTSLCAAGLSLGADDDFGRKALIHLALVGCRPRSEQEQVVEAIALGAQLPVDQVRSMLEALRTPQNDTGKAAEKVSAALMAEYGRDRIVGIDGAILVYCDAPYGDVDWASMPPLQGFWRELTFQEEVDLYWVQIGGGAPYSLAQRAVKRLVYGTFEDEAWRAGAVPGVCFPGGFMIRNDAGELEMVPHSPAHRARCCLPFDPPEYDEVEECIERIGLMLPAGPMVEGFRAFLEENLGYRT